MLRRRIPQSGFTIVELLIGNAIGLLVIAGAITIYATTAAHQATTIQAANLEKELRALMTAITSDLRRAGYAALLPGVDNNLDGSIDINDFTFNPFSAAGNDITLGAKTGESANSCVTYSYNLDEESPPSVGGCIGCGALPGAFTTVGPYSNANLPFDQDNMEMFGLRLNGGRVESRSGFAGTESTFDCNSGSWAQMTTSSAQITALTFSLSHTQIEVDEADIADADATCGAGLPCQCIREVTVSLAASLPTNSLVSVQLSETVRVRNDKFLAAFDTGNPCRG